MQGKKLGGIIMATITLQYDGRNPLIKSILNSAILAGAEIEETDVSPYNKGIVGKTRGSKKQSKTKMSGLDKALLDVKEGRVYRAKSVEDLIKKCS